MSNMTPKLILLSGGKGCGKTELVKNLNKFINDLTTAECKAHLHVLTMKFFNVDQRLYWRLYENRELKETPNENYQILSMQAQILAQNYTGKKSIKHLDNGYAMISPRAAMIYVSEMVCKPTFGNRYFGDVRASHLESGIYIDDSVFGTMDEIYGAMDKIGAENILLIKITGRGTYEDDSRTMLETDELPHQVEVYNDPEDKTHAYVEEGVQHVINWLRDKFMFTGDDL